MVASCESCLLIGCGFTDLEGLILLNPTTRVLPKFYVATHNNYAHYGMCHCLDNEFNDDIKVVRFVQYHRGIHDVLVTEVIVYSLNTNLWKLVECKPTTPEWCHTPVLVQNHLLVMIFESGSRLTRIGCFDIKAERWSNDVVLPDILLYEIESNPTPKSSEDYYHLGALDGCLRFSCYDENNSTYSVWVMKDVGVKESWVKLMSLPGKGPESVYHPIAYKKGSSHELLCIPNSRGKFSWYNLRDKKFPETGFDVDGLYTDYLSFAYICKESLLNFPGGLQIRSLSREREVDDDYADQDKGYYDDGYFYEEGEWFPFEN
ncbi:F-box protein CPR1-like [Silene latifolia]|uniref:F-box protein CPR1-like n=1 Tax=Silene latifolia TaxID=37657 RepID=UPI003D786AF3